MNVWKMWSVMAQGLKKLNQYSIQLQQVIFLLNEVLPQRMSHVILHPILIAPSSKQKTNVAKDQYLEIQDYWLKYFFNHSGQGT